MEIARDNIITFTMKNDCRIIGIMREGATYEQIPAVLEATEASYSLLRQAVVKLCHHIEF